MSLNNPPKKQFKHFSSPSERSLETSPTLFSEGDYLRFATKASPTPTYKAFTSNDIDLIGPPITPSTIKYNKYNKIGHSSTLKKNLKPIGSPKKNNISMVASKNNQYDIRTRHSVNDDSRLFQAIALSPIVKKEDKNFQPTLPAPASSIPSYASLDESLLGRSHLIHYINKQNEVISKYSYNGEMDFLKVPLTDKFEKNSINGIINNNRQQADEDIASYAEFKKARKYV